MTIQEKAQRAIDRGSKMTFDEIVSMLEKSEAKKKSSSYKRKDAKKWDQRESVKNTASKTDAKLDEYFAEQRRNQAKAAGLI